MEIGEFEQLFTAMTNFKQNRFHPLVWINGDPVIGVNVYIGGMSEVNAGGARVEIGDNCDIASFVSINCADSHRKALGLAAEIERKDITIEENVFIGSHSVVKGGAHIGHHSVVAAGTIVGEAEIPPYSLVYGNPMQVKSGYYLRDERPGTVPHNRPALGREEEQAAVRVLRSGWLAQGNEVANFEQEFCRFLDLPPGHAVAVSSGTAALFLALWALGARGQKVALPVYACSALRHAAAMAGATECLVDTAPESPNADLGQIRQSGVSLAIVPHMFGLPVPLQGLEHLDVIEDCAQALGAKINGTAAGLQGKIGIYSFYATKLATSGGQGGMIVAREKSLIDAIRDYREFDLREDRKQRFNFQMTDLQAAVGREQLKKLPDFLARREKIFNRYREAGLELLDASQELPGPTPVRYRAVLKTGQPRETIQALAEAGIRAIVPIEEWELLGEPSLFPNALRLAGATVSLPLYPSLAGNDVDRIIKVVAKKWS